MRYLVTDISILIACSKGGGLNQCKDLTETIDIESFYVFFFKNIHLF